MDSPNSSSQLTVHSISEGSDVGNLAGISYLDAPSASTITEAIQKLNEHARALNISLRQVEAEQFMKTCTLDSVLKTYIRSGFATSWTDKSYGMSWVAVHSKDNSVCVVTRHNDLDMARVSDFHGNMQKDGVMYDLTAAIMSEVESLPFDDDFRKRSGLSIEKPFGLVSVFPGQLTSSVEYDKDKAIDLLKEKMGESVITLDDAIKIALSAFKHMCLQELEPEEYWVGTLRGLGCVTLRLPLSTTEKHLADINSGSDTSDNGRSEESSENIDSGSGALAYDENIITM